MKLMKSEEEDDEVARIDKCNIVKMLNNDMIPAGSLQEDDYANHI